MPEEIIWTALPNGHSLAHEVVTADQLVKLKLSVHVSPRLTQGARLDAFPNFINWPRALETIRFVVWVGGESFVEGNRLTRVQAADGELWAALFKDDTFVRSHTADDYSDRLIHSYPVMNVMAFIKKEYTRIAIASPVNLPSIGLLIDSFQRIAFESNGRRDRIKNQRDRLRNIHRQPPQPPAVMTDPVRDDFLQVDLFHAPQNSRLGPSPLELPDIDFHQTVSLLGEYPEVLRLLGLVIDFTIDVDPRILDAASEVFIEPHWASEDFASAHSVTPHTAITGGGSFFAAPRHPKASDLTNRFLKLRGDRFGVMQVDVDGAAIKLMNLGGQLNQLEQLRTKDAPTAAGVPSIRSGGLSIVRTGRAQALGERFRNIAELNTQATTNSVQLFADDLLRGYRVDIREISAGGPGEWFSLCRRTERHHFTGVGRSKRFEDVEGVASMGVMQKPQTLEEDFVLHESMFRWAGWSLCVPPRPESGADDQTEVLLTGSKPALGLESRFSVSGPLPDLRFGRVYQFRVRTADLAGNGPAVSAHSDESTVTNVGDGFYARFEPVSAPVIVPLSDFSLSPGESAERMVVRSNVHQDPEEYLATLGPFESATDTRCEAFPPFRLADYHAKSERRIAPPRIGRDTAETHGMFDSMSAEELGLTRERIDDVPTHKPHGELDITYLPDPLAEGACFVNLPGAGSGSSTQVLSQIPFVAEDERWPVTHAFRLQVEGVSHGPAAPPSFDRTKRVLTVQVPQAEVVKFRISSLLKRNGLKLMGIWRWIEEGIETATATQEDELREITRARRRALNGLHWMLTPHREMVIVHAVQQPLIEPSFARLQPLKSLGETFATFEGSIDCDGKSTGKIDVIAEWNEPVDDPSDPAGPHCADGPQPPIPHQSHAFAFTLNFKGPVDSGDLIEVTDGDRTIAAYNHERRVLVFEFPTFTSEPRHTFVATLPRHDFGDTKHRQVGYTAVATTRFREYFHCLITLDETNITRRSPKTPRHIVSSARPDAPKVLYVVPTFGWERTSQRGAIHSTRRGGGLRVYMERPWFSSGEGELLGVVLWTGELPEDSDQLSRIKPYITRWGLDPIRSQKSLPFNLGPELFRNAKELDPEESQTTGLTLEELGLLSDFSVVPYEVAYDEVRRLWFCDIEIDPGEAYFPFVRLALARYQPHSANDVYLSRVVLADFAQLTPDRSASVTLSGSGPIRITVSGKAFADSGEAGENRVIATVQARSSLEAELGWTSLPKLSVELQRSMAASGVKLNAWSGELQLPQSRRGAHRLLIQEWERYRGDAQPEGDDVRERLVYAEALEL